MLGLRQSFVTYPYLDEAFQHLNSISSSKKHETDNFDSLRFHKFFDVYFWGVAVLRVRCWERHLAMMARPKGRREREDQNKHR